MSKDLVYRQTNNYPKQSIRNTSDVWELGYEEDLSSKSGKVKETQVGVRPVNDSSVFDYQVDIIVPFHGQYEKVTKLIESIYQCTRSNYYTLTLVDDASPNDAFIQRIAKNGKQHLKALRTKEQKGFAGAAKVAYDRTESPYVCIINSDCIVKDINWLRAMGETLLKLRSEGVKMVAPRTNNPTSSGSKLQLGEKPQSNESSVFMPDSILLDDHLSMYCIMCHRELFNRIGFIKEYPYGFYEDEEFAARMRSHGYKQAVCGNSWVYHEGGCTIKYLWRKDPQIRLVMENENRERCINDMSKFGTSQ